MIILQFVFKVEYFDVIVFGEKIEEYCEVNVYWIKWFEG